jgi:hypothetical protein
MMKEATEEQKRELRHELALAGSQQDDASAINSKNSTAGCGTLFPTCSTQFSNLCKTVWGASLGRLM